MPNAGNPNNDEDERMAWMENINVRRKISREFYRQLLVFMERIFILHRPEGMTSSRHKYDPLDVTSTSELMQVEPAVLSLIRSIRHLLESGIAATSELFYIILKQKRAAALQNEAMLRIFQFMVSYFKISEDELTKFVVCEQGWHFRTSAKKILFHPL